MVLFKKVYFAHSKQDYYTKYEAEMCVYLESLYHGSDCSIIIDPLELEFSEKYQKRMDSRNSRYAKYLIEMEFYFSEIKKCDDLVAIYNSKTGKFTDGVKREIAYAQENGVNTYRLEVDDKIKFVGISKDFSDGIVLINEQF